MIPLTELFDAFRWWLMLAVLGTAVWPLAFTIFHRLPERGYAFVKMLGLLLTSYLFWILGSLGFLNNNLGGILFALLLVTGLSWIAYLRFYRGEQLLWEWMRDHKTQILLTEGVFLLIFALWVWVRAQNPAIAATEKPMEFAFLNAVGRSESFPPLDPWLSGYAISYYYFGYVMTSLLARLSGVAEPIAFNLAVAWLVAGTAVGSFGLVYNLTANKGRRLALLLGVLGALAIPIAGNMQIGMEVAYANEIGSDEFWQWLDVRDLNTPELGRSARYEGGGWWWWRSSRVIHEYHLSGRVEEGLEPIVEFPSFSFILGDLHPHVLSLPFAVLSLAVALAWWLNASAIASKVWDESTWWEKVQHLIAHMGWPLWLVTIIVIGGLSFLNTWDVLIHLFVVIATFAVGQWIRRGVFDGRLLSQTIGISFLIALPAILLYLPFYLGFSSQAGAPYLYPMLMQPTRLPHFLIIFGLPLWAITFFAGTLFVKQRAQKWQVGLGTAVGLLLVLFFLTFFFGWILASSPDGAWRVTGLADELGIALRPRPEGVSLSWGFRAVLALMPIVLSAKLAYVGVVLLLTTLASIIMMRWAFEASHPEERPQEMLPFVLVLLATAVLLTIGPEFVYLRDNFGMRLNTTFKFYYQAWLMFGVVALFALAYIWQQAKIAGGVVTVGYVVGLSVALLFPIYGVRSRAIEYRGPLTSETRQPATLNGLAQVERFNPAEYEALMWLRNNVEGTPVIVEAVGGQYSAFARVSANTGLPTLLGWAGHQYQWRGGGHPAPGPRDPDVNAIYTQPTWEETRVLLDRYNAEYIFVGNLEESTYGAQVRNKFDGLEVAFDNGNVTIFRWHPQ